MTSFDGHDATTETGQRLGDSPAAAPTRPRARRRGLALALLAIVLLAAGAGGAYLAIARPTLPDIGQLFPRRAATPTAPVGADYTLAGGGPCVTLGRNPQPPFANVQVSSDSFPAHSEPMLASNPNNPLNLVGGSKFFTDPAHYRFKIGTYASFDGGCTWTDGGMLPGFADKSLTSDISFGFGTSTDVYAAVLFVGRDGIESGIAVAKSSDGGRSFAPPVSVFDDRTGVTFSDKPWIGVDTTNGPHRGSIYVVWSDDYGSGCGDGNACFQELGFSRSTDGGQTFAKTRLVEGSAPFCNNPASGRPASSTRCDGVLGATPAVEADGTLAVAYAYIDVTSGNRPTKMVVQTSRDGGTTWATPVLVATIHDTPGTLRPDRFRNFSLPAFTADPTTADRLYIAWADEGHGDADILLSSSKDGGATWSAPLRVNDDPIGNGANQVQPQLAVAPNGVVSVSFFDTRNDPAHRLLDVYLAQSTDGGVSVRPNVRVTTVSIDPGVKPPLDGSGQQFFGDYQGLAADNLFAHPFWNDTRTGDQQIFTAAVPSAQP